MKSYGPGAAMKSVRKFSRAISLAIFLSMFLSTITVPQNSVEGEVQFVGSNKAEKSAGVWIDGQYVGYVSELKDEKKVLLLPGHHEISVRQTEIGRASCR